ncbi:U-box domain-containing protein 51 [Diplonema papillatum]|nr:U-box domain-containing protein 51 [Diplonema papillatum]
MPRDAPNYMRPTRAANVRRFSQSTTRLRRLTSELAGVQGKLAARLSEYQQECAEAELLVARAVALTNRLKSVRERLRAAVGLRARLAEAGLMETDDAVPWVARLRNAGTQHDDTYGSFELEDTTEPEPVATLPDFNDGLDKYTDEAPSHFLCPITCDIMRSPVMTCDGHTYEERAIVLWFVSFREGSHAPTSPLTNLPLASLELRPNEKLQREIREWLAVLQVGRAEDQLDSSSIRRIKREMSLRTVAAAAASSLGSPCCGRLQRQLLGSASSQSRREGTFEPDVYTASARGAVDDRRHLLQRRCNGGSASSQLEPDLYTASAEGAADDRQHLQRRCNGGSASSQLQREGTFEPDSYTASGGGAADDRRHPPRQRRCAGAVFETAFDAERGSRLEPRNPCPSGHDHAAAGPAFSSAFRPPSPPPPLSPPHAHSLAQRLRFHGSPPRDPVEPRWSSSIVLETEPFAQSLNALRQTGAGAAPIWSSSVVPAHEADAEALNGIRGSADFRLPEPPGDAPAAATTAAAGPGAAADRAAGGRGVQRRQARSLRPMLASTMVAPASTPIAGSAAAGMRIRARSLNFRCR